MSDYEEYFKTICDKYTKEIEPFIFYIKNHLSCPNCGGTFHNGTCKYCETTNKGLDKNVTSLVSILNNLKETLKKIPINSIPLNSLFNLLLSVKSIEIDSLNEFIEDFNISLPKNEDIKKSLEELSKGLEVTDNDLLNIEYYIYQNPLDEKLIPIYKIFIRNALLNSNPKYKGTLPLVSFPSFIEVIKNFTTLLMKDMTKNPQVVILPSAELNHSEDMTKVIIGEALFNIIRLNKEDVKNLYEKGSDEVIKTIFHELTHVHQYGEVLSGNHIVNAFSLDVIKEYIISLINSKNNYYQDNYENDSLELEARFNEAYLTYSFISSLGLIPRDENIRDLEDVMRRTENRTRTLKGEFINLDEYFKEIILTKPELLTRYPQLEIEFMIKGGIVTPKPSSMLKEEYMQKLSDPNISDEEKAALDKIYASLGIGR